MSLLKNMAIFMAVMNEIGSKDELLQATNGGEDILLNIFKSIGSEFKGFGQKHLNPFYSDTKPALIFTKKDNTILFKDFGNDVYSGDIFEFASIYYNRRLPNDFSLLLSDIASDLNLSINDYKNVAPQPRKSQIRASKLNVKEMQLTDLYLVSYKPAPDYNSIPYPNGYISEAISFEKLVELMTAPTQFVFCQLRDGYRKRENFIEGNVVALDFDEVYLHDFDDLMWQLYRNPNCFLAYETKRSCTRFDDFGSPIMRIRALFRSNIVLSDANKYKQYLAQIFNQYKRFNPDQQAIDPTHPFNSGGKSIYDMRSGQNIRLWRYWTYE